MAAALANAKTHLLVQPGRNRAVLKPLLREVQQRLLPYEHLSPDAAEISNDFPALHVAVTAYMEALGAQPLHPQRGVAKLLPVSRPKARTHEDIYEQALQSLQPHLIDIARRKTLSNYIFPPREEGNVLPSYAGLPRNNELPPDLDMRIQRSLRKMLKPLGTALSDPAPSVLLEDLKSLLGSGSVSAAERGEILYRLAVNIPSELQKGSLEQEKLARLFLRFLAPDRLAEKYHQAPVAFSAGVGTARFNPEVVVSNEKSELIMLALLGKIERFGPAGTTVCEILRGTLKNRREIDPVMHARLLRQSVRAIHTVQDSFSNSVLLRDLISVIVEEIKWLDKYVSAMAFSFFPMEDMIETLDLHEFMEYNLRGMSISSEPEWRGNLGQLTEYNRLLRNLAELPTVEAFVNSGSDSAPSGRSNRGGPSGT